MLKDCQQRTSRIHKLKNFQFITTYGLHRPCIPVISSFIKLNLVGKSPPYVGTSFSNQIKAYTERFIQKVYFKLFSIMNYGYIKMTSSKMMNTVPDSPFFDNVMAPYMSISIQIQQIWY